MQFRSVALLTLLISLPIAFASPTVVPERKCGNDEPIDRDVEASIQDQMSKVRFNTRQDKSIPVNWHIITDGKSGKLSASAVQKSIDVLNNDYAESGFSFYLDSSEVTQNANWFKNVKQGSSVQKQMKTSLRKGDSSSLNIYTVDLGPKLLGYATFPWEYAGKPQDDGVVIQYTTYPGGPLTGFNGGRTLTHEVGHWLGLYHVFTDGCSGDGDFVDDTPPQATVTQGCPTSQDSCPGDGPDSIHNYMDYSTDACMNNFTPGQISRMNQVVGAFRG